MRLFLLALLLALVASPAQATAPPGSAPDDYDAQAIRGAEIPADAPTFAQFPVASVWHGRFAAPRVNDSRRARQYRTAIRESAAEGTNFAGHYRLVQWGCGTGCAGLAIVDGVTGRVFFPPALRYAEFDDIAFDEFGPPPVELMRYRPDSRLLVLIGGVNGDSARRGISYFVWECERLKRVRFVPHPW